MRFIHWIVQILLRSPKFPGRDFLIERLPKWFLKKARQQAVIHTRFGFKIYVEPKTDLNIENLIYERGVYEYGTVHFLQQQLKGGDGFVDVGANIGFLSMVAANCVGPNGFVHAFEPVSSTVTQLKKNVAINSAENITIYPFALGDDNGQKVIYLEDGNKGGASISNKHSEQFVTVDCKQLDTIITDEKIRMIKIDVEGFELEVLKGGLNLILRDRPILIVEVSMERENEGSAGQIFDWISGLECYRIYKLKKGKDRPSDLEVIQRKDEIPAHDNIICMPIHK